MAKVPKVMKPSVGEVYHSIEAPKGELGYFIVSDNSTQPYRVRVRPPSFINLQALDRMVRGGLVAEVVAIIGTIDIVVGEVDRYAAKKRIGRSETGVMKKFLQSISVVY